jgi:hypothetical protein
MTEIDQVVIATQDLEQNKKSQDEIRHMFQRVGGRELSFKFKQACEPLPFPSVIKSYDVFLGREAVEQCRTTAKVYGIKFTYKNPVSGPAKIIKRFHSVKLRAAGHGLDGPYSSFDVVFREDDMAYTEAIENYLALLDELEKDTLEVNAMNGYTGESKDESVDEGTVGYQLDIQEELLSNLSSVTESLGNRLYSVLSADDRNKAEDTEKAHERLPDLVQSLKTNNNVLTGYIIELKSILARVRL